MSDEGLSWSCDDCKHCVIELITTYPNTWSQATATGGRVRLCRAKKIDVHNSLCADMRMFGGRCGPSASLFEPE